MSEKSDSHFKKLQKNLNGIARDTKQFADIASDIKQFKLMTNYKFEGAQHRFEYCHKDLKDIKKDISCMNEDLEGVRKDVEERFGQLRALRRNGFVNRLIHPITKVGAFTKDKNGVSQCLVAPDFPSTIKHFWLLSSNIPALQRLAKHYGLEGWQDWNANNSSSDEETQHDSIDVAVSAHPELCLELLALEWGLEYRKLERLSIDGTDMSPTVQKRKAGDELESRRVRHKVDEEEIIHGDKDEVLGKIELGSELTSLYNPEPSPEPK